MWCGTETLYTASIKNIDGEKWGYINNKGEFIIKPKYDYAKNFQDNCLAIVEFNNRYGIIDESGKYVLLPKYDTINQFSEGRAVVVDKDGFKLIDESGKEITTKPYNFIGRFQDGRALYSIADSQGKWLYGYLDRQGNEVIPVKYENASDFKDGKAIVKIRDGEYALIGLSGKVLNTYKYAYVGNRGDGLLAFRQDVDGKYGFIDEDGNVVIQPKYTSTQSFSEGRTVVNISEDYGNSYGLIDKKGDFIIKPKYNDIQLLGENRASVGIPIDKKKPFIGSKYAIADTDGKFLTNYIYYGVSNYKDELASAYDNKYTFFIDKSGKRVKSLPVVRGSGNLTFEKDVIKADVDYRQSYLDKEGNIIYKQNTIIPLNEQYSVKEKKINPNKDYVVYYPQVKGMVNKKAQKRVNKNLKELSQIKDINSYVQFEYNYSGDFSIEFFKNNLLVLELWGYKYYFGAAHGMPTEIYVHVDLVSGRFYELKDLFKEDSNYVKVLSDIIENQIKNNEEYSYVWLDNYKGIKENQPFYVTEDALYIYFYPYEIAPYVAGFPTFKIPYADIMNIIDVNGEFWRAFKG